MSDTDISVVFEESACRSAAYCGGKLIGECEYDVSGGEWVVTHTGVRPEFGGRGIARQLAETVISEARSRQVKIRPLCSYVLKMMDGKAEYEDVLAR